MAEFGDARLPARFWSKVSLDQSGCWLWTAGQNRNGYARFMDSRQVNRVGHRIAYEALIGSIPEGLQLDHLCRVRHCVNPSHVEPVTQRENLRRGDTITARSAAATHCPAGHPYTGDNLYINPKGHRYCRKCQLARNAQRKLDHPEIVAQQHREADRRYRERKRARAAAGGTQ
ncbi:HNH endonuclease signature motif containing protein [Streptomyces sp.]|uniref:HNH endonuclease signature motif containing protein n=1 Tax=Streptomyces sp. TaxID=1931 RepID=UPI002F93B8F8